MFPYMIGKDKGAFTAPFEYAIKCFAAKDPHTMSENSGAIFDPDQSIIQIKSLGQMLEIKYPEGDIVFNSSKHMPAWNWRWLILHYLSRADDTPVINKLISYRELENGNVNYTTILSKCINPLIKNLLPEPVEQIKAACLMLDASIEQGADVCAKIHLFPRFPLTIKLWLGDDEINGSANILFDVSANHYLDTEAINEAAIMVSHFLIKQYELMHKKII
ncbi:DUF3786 domain-containing protein [Sporomusa sphaeroides DSM 2875]|uniref:DUF3786 domain-containing protein n=1 Tax=Sporomusa sphaeroides TaxID=47679 RepID=UPI00202F8465|nr:DUF3786 domain-containing protein [Sporomusa sphaeroides]MCM0758406.1 DUF3786 domain-containing protein [Sporomusa sphaeroides DSM 2875]